MHKPFTLLLAATLGLSGATIHAAPPIPYLHAPSVDSFAKHDPTGVTILSNGRLLTPAGTHVPVAHDPYGLAITRDGATLFIASEGVGQLVQDWQSGPRKITPVRPEPGKGRKKNSNTGGADFSPDGKTLYWSGGESGGVMIFDAASGNHLADVALNGPLGTNLFEGSYTVDIKVSDDGKLLY